MLVTTLIWIVILTTYVTFISVRGENRLLHLIEISNKGRGELMRGCKKNTMLKRNFLSIDSAIICVIKNIEYHNLQFFRNCLISSIQTIFQKIPN